MFLSCTALYQVLPSFTGFLISCTAFYIVLPSVTGFSLSFTGCYLVLPRFTGLPLGFTGFWLGFDWVFLLAMPRLKSSKEIQNGDDRIAINETMTTNSESTLRLMDRLRRRVLHLFSSFVWQVRDLIENCSCPTQFPMIRVSEGKYRIGDTKMLIFVRVSALKTTLTSSLQIKWLKN